MFDWASSQGLTEWNENLRRLSSTPDRKFVADVLEVKLPMSGDRHISLSSVLVYNEHPQALTIHSGDVQRLDYSSFHTHTSASFRHRLFRMYANYQVGFRGMSQSLRADIARQTSITKQGFENYVPYIGTGLNFQNNSLHLSADIKLNCLRWRWKGREYTEKNTSFHPDAKLLFSYILSGTSTLNMNYRYSEDWQDLRQMYDGGLFTSYRTMVHNIAEPEDNETHRLSLRYQYSQPIKVFFLAFSIGQPYRQAFSIRHFITRWRSVGTK